jgi:hypothetical protein
MSEEEGEEREEREDRLILLRPGSREWLLALLFPEEGEAREDSEDEEEEDDAIL